MSKKSPRGGGLFSLRVQSTGLSPRSDWRCFQSRCLRCLAFFSVCGDENSLGWGCFPPERAGSPRASRTREPEALPDLPVELALLRLDRGLFAMSLARSRLGGLLLGRRLRRP